jgi:hypothetical protein
MIRRIIAAVALVWCTGIFAGCATTTTPVSFLYSPSVGERGGSGDLFMKTASVQTAVHSANNVRWVIGQRKDSDGMVTGEILSTNSAEGIVLDALKQELTAAGYRVEVGSSMPAGVNKGLELASVQVEIEETAGIPRVEATGRIKVSFEVWKNGVKIKKLSYESRTSDFTITHRDRLPREMIERGLNEVMNQAVPDIVAALERKSAN